MVRKQRKAHAPQGICTCYLNVNTPCPSLRGLSAVLGRRSQCRGVRISACNLSHVMRMRGPQSRPFSIHPDRRDRKIRRPRRCMWHPAAATRRLHPAAPLRIAALSEYDAREVSIELRARFTRSSSSHTVQRRGGHPWESAAARRCSCSRHATERGGPEWAQTGKPWGRPWR